MFHIAQASAWPATALNSVPNVHLTQHPKLKPPKLEAFDLKPVAAVGHCINIKVLRPSSETAPSLSQALGAIV